MATAIASQAVISGAFRVTRQATCSSASCPHGGAAYVGQREQGQILPARQLTDGHRDDSRPRLSSSNNLARGLQHRRDRRHGDHFHPLLRVVSSPRSGNGAGLKAGLLFFLLPLESSLSSLPPTSSRFPMAAGTSSPGWLSSSSGLPDRAILCAAQGTERLRLSMFLQFTRFVDADPRRRAPRSFSTPTPGRSRALRSPDA